MNIHQEAQNIVKYKEEAEQRLQDLPRKTDENSYFHDLLLVAIDALPEDEQEAAAKWLLEAYCAKQLCDEALVKGFEAAILGDSNVAGV